MQFPTLSSGAVIQYGSVFGSVQPAQIIRFLDGSDQRFLASGRGFRRWLVSFHLLNEAEIASIEAFFQSLAGEYSTFSFPDPVSGLSIPNCRVGAPELITDYQGVDVSATSMWVVETNG